MKKTASSKLARKCLILVFMILGLAFVASTNRLAQPVAAAPCCEDCEGSGDPTATGTACYWACAIYYAPGSQAWENCYDDCMNSSYQCYSHCTWCFSSGPGGECSSNQDCPPNYFCAADNTCTHY